MVSFLPKNIVPIYVSVMVCFFANTSWVTVSGIFIQLPLLVESLPEGWKLPSYLAIIVQLGNIAPVIYGILERCCPKLVEEVRAIYACIGITIVCSLLLATTWSQTVFMFGSEYSLSLLILSFFVAMVACTSSVTFLPYMARFKEEYLTAFFLGKGVSGLLLGLLTLAQGVGEDEYECLIANSTVGTTLFNSTRFKSTVSNLNFSSTINSTAAVKEQQQKIHVRDAKFSAEVFFILIMIINIIGLLCFIGLNKFKFCESEFALDDDKEDQYSNKSKRSSSHLTIPSLSIDNVYENQISLDESFDQDRPRYRTYISDNVFVNVPVIIISSADGDDQSEYFYDLEREEIQEKGSFPIISVSSPDEDIKSDQFHSMTVERNRFKITPITEDSIYAYENPLVPQNSIDKVDGCVNDSKELQRFRKLPTTIRPRLSKLSAVERLNIQHRKTSYVLDQMTDPSDLTQTLKARKLSTAIARKVSQAAIRHGSIITGEKDMVDGTSKCVFYFALEGGGGGSWDL